MARHKRNQSKERQWRGLLARWQRSGLSVRAFCDRECLSEASFYGWRRELALRGREAAPAPTQTAPPTTVAPQGRPLFVPVQLERPLQSANDAIVIVLDRGHQVRVAPGFDSHTLQRVLAVLRECGSEPAEGKPC